MGDVVGLGGHELDLGGVVGGEETLAALGGVEVIADAADDAAALGLRGALQLGDLGVDLDHAGVGGGVDGLVLGALAAKVGQLGLDVLEGGVVLDLADGLDGGLAGELVAGLAGDALGLGLAELVLELLELLVGDVVLLLGEDQVGLAGVGLEGVLGLFELDLDFLHLVLEELAGVLGGLPAGVEVLLNELRGEGVGEVGGGPGVGGVHGDIDEAGVGLGADLEGVRGHLDGFLAGVAVFRGGEVEGLAPGGEAGAVRDEGLVAGLGLFDGALNEGAALEDLDLGLDVDLGVVAVAAGVGRVDVLHVHEVVVEALDLEGGAGLVDGGLGEGEEDAGDEAEDGDEDDGAAAALDDAPVLEEASGGGLVLVLVGVVDVGRAG